MIVKGLKVTKHAYWRFCNRIKKAHPEFNNQTDAMPVLLRLMTTAERCQIAYTSYINRSGRHQGDAEYYMTKCGWRFVVVTDDEGNRSLVTCERLSKRQN